MAETWEQFLQMLSGEEAIDGDVADSDVELVDMQPSVIPQPLHGPFSASYYNMSVNSNDIFQNGQTETVYTRKFTNICQNEALRKLCEQLSLDCDKLFRDDQKLTKKADEEEKNTEEVRKQMKIEKEAFNVISDYDLRRLAMTTEKDFLDASEEKRRLHIALRNHMTENYRLHLLQQSYLQEIKETKEIIKCMHQFVTAHQGEFVEFQGCHAEGELHSEEEEEFENEEDEEEQFILVNVELDEEVDAEVPDEGTQDGVIVHGEDIRQVNLIHVGDEAPEAGDHAVRAVDGHAQVAPRGGAGYHPLPHAGLPVAEAPLVAAMANEHPVVIEPDAPIDAVDDEPERDESLIEEDIYMSAADIHPLIPTLSLSSRESYHTASSAPSGSTLRRDRANQRFTYKYYLIKSNYLLDNGTISPSLHLFLDGTVEEMSEVDLISIGILDSDILESPIGYDYGRGYFGSEVLLPVASRVKVGIKSKSDTMLTSSIGVESSIFTLVVTDDYSDLSGKFNHDYDEQKYMDTDTNHKTCWKLSCKCCCVCQ